jgi:hypothetical protein
MVNNKTQHFKYDQAFQAYAGTFRLEDFPTLIKAAFSVVTAEVEKDHQSTSLRFVTIVQLWFKIVAFLRQQHPKTTAQQIHLTLLTSPDVTDLLAQFTIDHVKGCDHCLYICMRRLTDCACDAIFNIAQAHDIPLIDITGKVIHHVPNQHVHANSQHPLRQFLPQPNFLEQRPCPIQPPIQPPFQPQQHFQPLQFHPPPQIFQQPVQLVRLPLYHPQHFLPQQHFLQQPQQPLLPPQPSSFLPNLDKLQIATEDVNTDAGNV